jgi:hypothetical protein
MRSSTWQLVIATGLGIAACLLLSYNSPDISAQSAPAAGTQVTRRFL